MREKLLVGIGENAGVVDIGDGWAVTFKIESHNHPSYVEPYQGAATGVGGIVRDIMAMGARPIAVMDSLRFGDLRPPRHRTACCPASSPGVGGYGNCLGPAEHRRRGRLRPLLPGQPAGQRALRGRAAARRDPPGERHAARATWWSCSAPAPAATASAASPCSPARPSRRSDAGPAKRPAVQVGDPFAEKVLIECCLELFAAEVVDGHPGPRRAPACRCATRELASNGDGGMHVHLDRVPLRDPTLRPEEILMSESQERMMAVVRPADLDAFLADHDEVGRRGRRCSARSPGPAGSWSAGTARPSSTSRRAPSPTRARSTTGRSRGPARLDARAAPTPPTGCRARRPGTSCAPCCCGWSRSPNLASRAWVTDQYDRYVLRQHRAGDAGRRRRGPGRRGDRPRRRARHRLQRPVRRARPLRGRPAGARRGVPQRRHRRRAAARRHRLPELRLARGPGRDVAVRAGRRRAWPTAAAELGIPVTGGQRLASTTRPATSRSTRRRWSACSG